ncbi:uncharacterized protein EHS24_008683 [Apiotrichum porosum]|uniref:Integral membrane protein n=1 Tax=Apiotrichum porosum TaxID=105984 RepID=A0A427XQV3_9TREE|nr:uncharacterized protein EHS24_008683 [Apiotrichum porosum]RSH81246.1 hypothetical protein EHS24_008683 [Apiotrichum porosum]
MGQVQSAFDPDNTNSSNAPVGYIVPAFPSLYVPSVASTIQQSGYFLHDAYAIWRFTFYWTLILLLGTFWAVAALASFNLLLSRTLFSRKPNAGMTETGTAGGSTGAAAGSARATSLGDAALAGLPLPRRARRKMSKYASRKRPPMWLIAFIPLVMGFIATSVALVSGTVVGFALAAVYSAAGFSMSTWVPFMWGMIQVVVLIISSYSSLTRVL